MLGLFLLIANLPWFGDRLFMVFSLQKKKMWVRLVELLVYYVLSLLIAIAFETRYAGDIYPQNWEFFVTTFSLFLVFAVPGVVYRYQWLPLQEKFK
jgi:glucan phosphoethanolaminetransferase (alkaline phosphatase superfamily)